MNPKFSKQFLRLNNLNTQYFLKTNPKIIHKLGISQLVLPDISPEDLIKLIKSLKSIKFLHTLKLRLGKCNPEYLKKVSNHFKAIKGIQSLKIDISDFYEEDLEELMALPRKTAYGRKLRELDVNFSRTIILPESIGHLPSLFLKFQPRLTNLGLKFKPLETFATRDLVLLSKRLQKGGSSLKNLKLDFPECYDVGLNGLDELTSRGFSNLPNLQNFSLGLRNSCPPDYGPSKYFSVSGLNLLKTKNLVCLDLNFIGWTGVSTKDFELLGRQFKDWSLCLKSLAVKFPLLLEEEEFSAFFESLGSLKTLESFKLTIDTEDKGESLPHETIRSLTEGLKTLEVLEDFRLKLKDIKLQNEDIGVLFEGIKTKSSLKFLKLNFSHDSEVFNEITSEGVHEIFDGLRELKELEGIEFNLNGCLVETMNISTLATSVEILKKLKQLRLCIENEDEELDLSSLLVSLCNLPELSNLGLEINRREMVGHDLIQISQNLKKIKSLKKLALSFGCNEESPLLNAAFEELFSTLKKIPTLTDLSVKIDKINNHLLQVLFKQLKGLNNLNSLFLGFYQEEVVDRETAEEFYQAMKTLNKLKNLALHFYNDGRIRDDAAVKFLKGVKKVRCVENLEFGLKEVGIYLYELRRVQERLIEKAVHMKSLRRFYLIDKQIIK